MYICVNVRWALQKFVPVCLRMSTVVLYPVYVCDCKQPEHNAGLIITVVRSYLLHLATQFLGVVLREFYNLSNTPLASARSLTSSDRHSELALATSESNKNLTLCTEHGC